MNHITTFDCSLNVPVTVKSIDGQIINYFEDYIVRVQSFLMGSFIKDVENPSPQLLNEFGEFLGK